MNQTPLRTKINRALLSASALGLFAILPLPAFALSYVMIRDDALVDRATLVVVAESVSELPGAVDAKGYVIDTRYLLQVERVVKGRLEHSSITLRLPGADASHGPAMSIPGTARLQTGSEVLLFLQARGDGSYEPADLALSVFHQVDADGERLYVRDLASAHQTGKRINEQYHRPRNAARFVEWIAHRAQGWRRQPDYFSATGAEVSSKFTLMRSGTTAVRWLKFDSGTPENWYAISGGQDGMARDEFALFQNALAAWTDDTTSQILYRYAGTTASDSGNDGADGKSTIVWNDTGNALPGSYGCSTGGTLAFGGSYVDNTSAATGGQAYHRIVESFVVVQDGAACVMDGHGGKDGEETILHELGHTLGLAHSCGDTDTGSCSDAVRNDAVMRASLHADGRGARLGVDDIAPVAMMYPVAGGVPPAPVEPDPIVPSRRPRGPGFE